MTFDKFRADFLKFLENSTVNLGRKRTKTRTTFLEMAMTKFDNFASTQIEAEICEENAKVVNKDKGRLVCLKPKKKNTLDVGKGVHSMTPSASQEADEQLNRSPFTNKKKNED